jgi:hypothetical protein
VTAEDGPATGQGLPAVHIVLDCADAAALADPEGNEFCVTELDA